MAYLVRVDTDDGYYLGVSSTYPKLRGYLTRTPVFKSLVEDPELIREFDSEEIDPQDVLSEYAVSEVNHTGKYRLLNGRTKSVERYFRKMGYHYAVEFDRGGIRHISYVRDPFRDLHLMKRKPKSPPDKSELSRLHHGYFEDTESYRIRILGPYGDGEYARLAEDLEIGIGDLGKTVIPLSDKLMSEFKKAGYGRS